MTMLIFTKDDNAHIYNENDNDHNGNVIQDLWYPECQKFIWQWVVNYVYVPNGEIMLNVKSIFVSRKIRERYDNDMSKRLICCQIYVITKCMEREMRL